MNVVYKTQFAMIIVIEFSIINDLDFYNSFDNIWYMNRIETNDDFKSDLILMFSNFI